jgi:hypothetical protein
MIHLPHFTRSLLARSLFTWFFIRLAVGYLKRAAEELVGLPLSHPLDLTPPAALMVAGLVATGGLVYARRRNEDLFLLCLGYERVHLVTLLVVPVLLLEMAIGSVFWL